MRGGDKWRLITQCFANVHAHIHTHVNTQAQMKFQNKHTDTHFYSQTRLPHAKSFFIVLRRLELRQMTFSALLMGQCVTVCERAKG